MGIKDVFDRIKGKPKSAGANTAADAAARRSTNEETVQVGIGEGNSIPSSDREQQDRTAVAPRIERPMPKAPPQQPPTAVPDFEANRAEPTRVAPPQSAPVPRPPAPSVMPLAAAAPAPVTEPEPIASPAAVNSADQTQYVVPEEEETHDLAGVLVGIFGETKNQVFLVRYGQCTLGRSETCEIQIMDAKVSREHAAITSEPGSVVIRALNERNPVWVNDLTIDESAAIADGDKLQFGNTGASIFRFRTIDGL